MHAHPLPRRAWLVTGLALAALLAWDASGGDLALARLAGNAHGFPWREHWLLTGVLHDGTRRLGWALVMGLALAVWWPPAALVQVPRQRRLQWAVTALAAAGLVSLAKGLSVTSCPWDLQAFGGLAPHLPHWSGRTDGGPGHCFPAGHASVGFSLVGGYFALRGTHPGAARAALAAALGSSLLLGLAQQWRGAHFMSHTLWSGWLCWTAALALDPCFTGRSA